MRYLLDTHLLLWSLYRPSRLPQSFLRILDASDASISFSVVSSIEIAIKIGTGRMEFSIDLESVRAKLLENGFAELQLRHEHALALSALPLLHRDPFDRLLVAQAHAEVMTLLTVDKRLAEYGPMVELLR